METENIIISGACEKNLKNINVQIPKNKITTVVGLSGSGKSALVFDTIASESQRQLNETFPNFVRNRLPNSGKAKVDSITNLPVSIVINQKKIGDNARSTVGTYTDMYSLLRLLFSRAGEPFVGYSNVFSFNNPKGMCENCQGLGYVNEVHIDKLLDMNKSLNDGAILFSAFSVGGYRWKRYVDSGLFDNDKKLEDYTNDEMDTLLYKSGFKPKNPSQNFPPTSLYEGIIPRIKRSFLSKECRDAQTYKSELKGIISKEDCPACSGSRLNTQILQCRIEGKNIADCVNMPLSQLYLFIFQINIPSVQVIIEELKKQLSYAENVGLGYLTLGRATSTLSGGESQRIKMIKQLGSSLNGLIYIFDEPSTGLHPHDISKINKLINSLKKKGNTILIVEHDPDIINISDYIIELGPYSGTKGGQVIFNGSLKQMLMQNSLTSNCLCTHHHFKNILREPYEWLELNDVSCHNINHLSIKIPKGILTVITGVAGSGKSTLITKILPQYYPECCIIDQKPISTNKRSNIATYLGFFDEIRKIFASTNKVDSNLFSYNSKGACPNCKGLGVVQIDLAFLDKVTETCTCCEGNRYIKKVLEYLYKGKNINDVLNFTIEEAYTFFYEENFRSYLEKLIKVGLGYIKLGQPLTSLSGGELQRLKLASKLGFKNSIYILDEPTSGLHPYDIKKLLSIFDLLIENGNTLLVIEHNLDIMCHADWIIDIGMGAGENGGKVVFSGIPQNILHCKRSVTGKFLKNYI